MTHLEACFDDSGKETECESKYVVLAGYMSTTNNWTEFNERWQGLLLLHGLPGLHMTNWQTVVREKGWNRETAITVLHHFADVAITSKLWGFGVGLDASAWRRMPRNKQRLFRSAQEFSMQRVLRMILDGMSKVELAAHINIVFDQDEDFSKPRLTAFYNIKRLDPRAKAMASVISFADSRACYSLQAADLLAYELRRSLIARERGDAATQIFTKLSTPSPSSRFEWDGWSASQLEGELDEAIDELRRAGRDVGASTQAYASASS